MKIKLSLSALYGLLSINLLAATEELTILYTNDLHSHLEPHLESWISESRQVGGFANLATMVKQEKAKKENTIYLDAGDYFSGPYVSSLTKGEAVIESMNHLGLDAACIGNHEFDYGWENMITQMNKAKFPILNANIFIKETGEPVWNNPYIIIKKGELNIGVIGLHGKFAFYDTINFRMIKGVEARDENIYLEKYLAVLKDQVDMIVVVIHHGMPGRQSSIGQTDVMRRLNSDVELAKRFPEINIIVSGHAHTGTPDALKVNDTLIVSTNAYTTELGKLEISFDKQSKKVVSYNNQLLTIFDDEVEDDKRMSEVVEYWQKEVEYIASEKISYTTSSLTRAYGSESNMGNLFADAMEDYDDAIDFAVVNSGALRQDISKGDVSFGDLISAFPFPNTLVSTKLTGSQIKEIFDHAAGLSNGILQVSKSFKYSFSPESHVINMWFNGKKIEENQLYNVASSSFLTDGGDGYLVFKKGLETKDTGINIYEVVKGYLANKKRFNAQIEGRIIEEI